MNRQITPEQEAQKRALLSIAKAITETVQESGPTPSGILYAALMGKLSYESYTALIDILIRSGKLKQSNNFLTYVGGAK